MKVEIHKIDFVYRFRYTDDQGYFMESEFPVHDPVVDYIVQSTVFLLTGRIKLFLDGLEYENGIATIQCDGQQRSCGLADHANPQRRMFLSAISALLELAELQEAQAQPA